MIAVLAERRLPRMGEFGNESSFTTQQRNLRFVEEIDLSEIMARIVKDHGWSEERAEEAEKWYRRFLCLCILFPKEKLAPPTDDADEVWHTHIIYTKKYHADCRRMFGYYLHHNPRGKDADQAELDALSQSSDNTYQRLQEVYSECPEVEMAKCGHPSCVGGAKCGNGKCDACSKGDGNGTRYLIRGETISKLVKEVKKGKLF